MASTRFLLQDEFNIQTTKCDNCIIVCRATNFVSQVPSIIPCVLIYVFSNYSGFYVLSTTNSMYIFHRRTDVKKFKRLLSFCLAWLIWFIARKIALPNLAYHLFSAAFSKLLITTLLSTGFAHVCR